MQSSNVIRKELMHYQENELIFASKLYKTNYMIKLAKQHFIKHLKECVNLEN